MIENSSVKHPDYPKAPPKNVTAQDIKKSEDDTTIERMNRDIAKKGENK